MNVRIGDRVQIESERVGMPTRNGEVTAVSGQMITIRWDDGHESVVMPTAGCLRVTTTAEEAAAAKK
ncbi:MAG: DUF1918 domain-containing protein [Mycobacteriales bacterium]|jgi:hypothetical protein